MIFWLNILISKKLSNYCKKNIIESIALSKQMNMSKFVTYVNASKHFDINHMMSFRFYRFRKIFEKKLFEISSLNFRRTNEKKSFIISFLW